MTTYNPKDIVETVSREIRDEADRFDPVAEQAALDRVWDRLSEESTEAAAPAAGAVLTCDDIAGLLPAYLSGDLKAERAMLIKDHTRTCLTCRRNLKQLERGESSAPAPIVASSNRWKWGLAAALVLVIGAVQYFVVGRLTTEGAGMIKVVEGALFSVSDTTTGKLAPGAEVPYGQEILTPRGSGAIIELADGSRVELRERSRIAVRSSRAGTIIDLEGGDIIVEAATQRDGKLFVDTGDCLVSVTGTVFSVSHGTRGSRVSVYEGEVRVDQAGAEAVLNPGDQVTTNASLASTALREEIDWSVNRERHLALLHELVEINRELRSMPRPDRRYDAEWLDRLPAATAVYVALPNLSDTIEETVQRLRQRVAQNPVLSEWIGQQPSFHEITAVVEFLAGLGDYLGDEIVVAAWICEDDEDDLCAPTVLATALDPATLRMRIQAGIAVLTATTGAEHIVLTDDPFRADLPEDALLIWVGDEVLVAATGRQTLAEMATALETGTGIADASFRDTIADRYADGVESLIAIDLASVVDTETDGEDRARLESLGLADVRHLVFEQWVENEQTRRQAVVSFDDERRGVAAWLAAPAPMGTLSFFSPDTTSVAAFIVQDPSVLFADILATLTDEERSEVETELGQFESEHGWSLDEDFFAPLGGEVAIGLDGPLAPKPSWKMVVEVYDPMTLQIGIERLVADGNQRLFEEGRGEITITAGTVNGREIWVITHVQDDTSKEVSYTYADGYLVATPTAALLDRALRFREAELGLTHSDRLRNLLPPGDEINVSALWYQDFSNIAGPLTRAVGGVVEGMEDMPPEMKQAITDMGESFGPSVFFAYGEADRIRISGTSAYNPLGLVNLLMMKGLGAADMMTGGAGGG